MISYQSLQHLERIHTCLSLPLHSPPLDISLYPAPELFVVPNAAHLVEACFTCLGRLIQPSHGSVRDTSARTLRNLTPALLGLVGTHSGSGGSHQKVSQRAVQMLRNRTLQFANDALR